MDNQSIEQNKLNNSIEQIMSLVQQHNTFVLSGHVNPDGDAIGATLAMALSLAKTGKKAYVLLEEFNHKFNLIPGAEFIFRGDVSTLNPDIFIALDCGDKHRLGEDSEALFDRTEITINIDHHISNPRYAKYNFIDAGFSSTSEILYSFITRHVTIDKDIATALYAGIVYDTGGFRHSSTKSNTHLSVAKLMEWDIPFTEVLNEMLYRHSYEEAKAFSKAIDVMKISEKYPIAFGYMSLEMLNLVGATTKELDGVVDYYLNTRGVEVAAFAYEKEVGVTKVSMRSDGIDVNKVASVFDGGGHVKASGCTIKKDIHEALNLVVTEIEKAMENNGK